MTVSDLMSFLKNVSPDTLVLVEGYEDHLSDILKPKEILVDLNVNHQEFYGPHSQSETGTTKAVVLLRKDNSLGK